LVEAYGTVLKEYAEVPDDLLKKANELKTYLEISYDERTPYGCCYADRRISNQLFITISSYSGRFNSIEHLLLPSTSVFQPASVAGQIVINTSTATSRRRCPMMHEAS
jgi:hypothetical protein